MSFSTLSSFLSFVFTIDSSSLDLIFLIKLGQSSGPSCSNFSTRFRYSFVASVRVDEVMLEKKFYLCL